MSLRFTPVLVFLVAALAHAEGSPVARCKSDIAGLEYTIYSDGTHREKNGSVIETYQARTFKDAWVLDNLIEEQSLTVYFEIDGAQAQIQVDSEFGTGLLIVQGSARDPRGYTLDLSCSL